MDTIWRSILKACTWYSIGIILLFSINYYMGQDVKTATTITAIFYVIRIILYISHEQLWGKIKWGHRQILPGMKER